VARAVPVAGGGFTAMVVIADSFGETPQPSFEEEAGVAGTAEAAIALAEAAAMRAIDAGQVN
jgi:hypothetical protein